MTNGFGSRFIRRLGLANTRRSALLATALLLSWLALPAFAWQMARPGYVFAFPRDHAAHPAYKTEWWYYTGHVQAADGRVFGYQLTFFRVGMPPGKALANPASAWRAGDVHVAHFAISDLKNEQFQFHERLQRGGVGLAWSRADRYEVVNGGWTAADVGGNHHLKARSGNVVLDLTAVPVKPLVIHGRNGVSVKSGCDSCASHYYSYTRMKTSGTLTLDGEPLTVLGWSWMDHEFGSNQLAEDEAGWDWFSLQFEDGAELMLYQLRRMNGTLQPESSGTYVKPDGKARHLTLSAFSITPTSEWISVTSRAAYPMGWRVDVPSEQLALTLIPGMEDQELRTTATTGETYWEGAVGIQGKKGGRPLGGQGYVEMTGYAGKFKARI